MSSHWADARVHRSAKNKSLGEICDNKSLYNTLWATLGPMFGIYFCLHTPFNKSAVLNSLIKLVTNLLKTLSVGEKYDHRHKQPNAPNMLMLQIILKRASFQAGPEKVRNSESRAWDTCKNCNYRLKNNGCITVGLYNKSWLQTNTTCNGSLWPEGSHFLINCRQYCQIWLVSPSFLNSMYFILILMTDITLTIHHDFSQ